MKEYINRLARGSFDYEPPVLYLSENHIEKEVSTEEDYIGTFTASGVDGRSIKGIVYSPDSLVTIENPIFSGVENLIRYRVHTNRIDRVSSVKGQIDVVSSGGEQSIRYVFHTKENKVDSSMGKIHNLFHFTNLVQSEPQEAKHLFFSKEFEEVFIRGDNKLRNVYRMVRDGIYPEHSIEEFLVGINKKTEVMFGISASEQNFENLTENVSGKVVIARNTWGYSDIRIWCDNKCIELGTKLVEGDMFAGNKYEFSYVVNVSECHRGKNYAVIHFESRRQHLTLKISICMESARHTENLEKQKRIFELLELYKNFRLKKIPISVWLKKSGNCIERLRAMDDNNLFYKLFHVQLLLAGRKREEAGWLIEYAGIRVRTGSRENDILYAYYLYLNCLYRQDKNYAKSVLENLHRMYEGESGYWQILWIIMYLDEDYEHNKTLKLANIKEQFYKGCISPVMYLEALNVLNEQPVLLRVFDEFELQILQFGLKEGILSDKLCTHVCELAQIKKSPSSKFTKLLMCIYERQPNEALLSVICKNLIRSERMERECFRWYELAVESGLKLTNLYEYYLYSCDKAEPLKLSKKVLMFFTHNSSLEYNLRVFLYASVIANRYEEDQIYEMYRTQMEGFVIDQIIKNRISDNLLVVYREILNLSMVKRDIAEGLMNLLFTYRLECQDKTMVKAYVKHKEFDEPCEYRLSKGVAFVRIYTADAEVIFEDEIGRRYAKSVDYKLSRLFDEQEYVVRLREFLPQNIWLRLYLAEKSATYDMSVEEVLENKKQIILDTHINEFTRLSYVCEIVRYYYSEYDGYELAEEYIDVAVDKLDCDYRRMILETYMINGCFEKALEIIRDYGVCGCNPKRVLRTCNYYIDRVGYEENELLLAMCTHTFLNGKYDEDVLKYLVKYFNGSTKIMLDLWKAADGFDIDRNSLDERLIIQMMFVHTYNSRFEKIFEDYYNSGARKRVLEAYIGYNSYNYFVRDTVIGDDVFRIIEHQLKHEKDVIDVAKLALLLWYSNRTMSEEQTDLAQELLDELSSKEIVFAFFRRFKGILKLPFHVRNTMVVEYVAHPDTHVVIHYIHMGAEGNKEYATEDMKMIYDGMFVKSFVLFYGESLQYYITEELNGQLKHTESHNLVYEEMSAENSEGQYEMINEILSSKALGDDVTFERLLRGYAVSDYVANEVFKPL